MRRLIVLNILRHRQYTFSSMNSKLCIDGPPFCMKNKISIEWKYIRKRFLSQKTTFILSLKPLKSIFDNITSFIQRRAILISYFWGSIFISATPDPLRVHLLFFGFILYIFFFFMRYLFLRDVKAIGRKIDFVKIKSANFHVYVCCVRRLTQTLFGEKTFFTKTSALI